ncbi:MAG: Gfo/Idh/MocA family protein [bacterium]
MERAFRWAFIGTGVLATKVAREIAASGRHELAAVYTRNPEKCAAFAARYGALAAGSAREAIEAAGVQGVYVVTPHTSHLEYARMALEAGKPVLCEKPVSTDAGKVAELIALSEEKGVYFSEGMWTWFSPVARQVKRWLDAGEYGALKKVHMTYHLRSIGYASRVSDPNLAGGALLDIGIYPVTYLYRLFGRPERLECRGEVRGGIDTGEEIALYYPGGLTATVSASILDFRGLERLELCGEKAKTILPFYHNAGRVSLWRRGHFPEVFRGDGSMLNEFDRVAEEIRAGRTESAYVPHSATLAVMELLDECRRQMGLVYPFEKG